MPKRKSNLTKHISQMRDRARRKGEFSSENAHCLLSRREYAPQTRARESSA